MSEMSGDSASDGLPHRRRRAVGVLLRVAFWSIAALTTLTLAAWLMLQWGILSRPDAWKPELQGWASRALGLQVRMGTLSVSGGFWSPTLTLHDLRLHDARDEETLRLGRVEVVLTPGSLLPRSLTDWWPQVRHLSLDALHLTLRRDAQGRVFLAGLPLEGTEGAGSAATEGQVLDWLLHQSEIRLRGASLSWQDERRGTEPLVLTGVDADLRNPLGRHVLHLSATPPEGWGSRFAARAEMTRPLRSPGDWRQWDAVVQADWPLVDVSRLRRHMDLPFDLLEGRGRLATRIAVAQGRLTGATADLQLQAVTLRVARGLPPVALQRISGQLDVQHDAHGSRVRARQLAFQSRPPSDATATAARPDPSLWPATDLELTLHGQPGAWTGGAFKASLVDLGLLAQSAAHVPLAGPMRRLLEATRPRGQVHGFVYDWSGDIERPDRWRARGVAEALQLAAAPVTAVLTATATPGRPGLRGARVRFDASDRGGQADLRLQDGELDFPGVFEQPRVALDRLDADVRWQLHRTRTAAPGTRPAIAVEVRRATFATADGSGAFSGHWRSGPPEGPTFGRHGWLPGTLDLEASVHQLRADRLHRYLPLGIAASVRTYVQQAVLAGTARDVRARVRGPVLDFPYTAPGQGEFALGGHFEQLTLDAVPGSAWPRYTDGAGQLVIDGQRLRLLQTQARLGQTGSGQFVLTGLDGGIDDLAHDPVLRLRGQGHGPTADLLDFLRTSPVDGWLDHAFTPAQGEGQARLALQLGVPLERPAQTTVQGRVDLDETRLHMRPDVPPLDALQAQIDFTEHSFQLAHGRAEVAGGALQFTGQLGDDGVLRFAGQGRATVAGLRRFAAFDSVAPVARVAHPFEGQADYRLQIDLPPGGPVVQVDSDLVGLSSPLPAPLRKGAAAAPPMRVRVGQAPGAATAGTAPTLLQVEAGTAAHPVLHTRLVFDGDAAARLRSGWLQLGAPDGQPWPEHGLAASVVLPRLSLDEWQAWLQRTVPQTLAQSAPAAPALLPQQIRLQVADLTLHGRHLTALSADFQPSGTPTTWAGTVRSDQLAGQLRLRPATAGAPAAVQARLGHLRLPWTADPASAPVSDHASDPLSDTAEPLPLLDVVVEQLVFAGHPLGRLELQGAPSPAGWQLQQLTLAQAGAQLGATGRWDRAGSGTSHLQWQLALDDGGRWLDQLGWAGTLRGGRGRIDGQLHWPGPPTALRLAHLGGTLRLALDGGQLLRADPGAGRLLGVLNLQSLPRRLSLDFRDLYQQGFSFDHVEGDVQIQQGLAHTRNLRVRGVQAMVLAEGSARLDQATQDLRVWVVPDFNAGAASLAYAVVNPAVGLGTLVTQWLLQRPLTEAATREFHVTGPWDTPRITPVLRSRSGQPPEPLPSTARKDETP
jgi:uncharacterized protein (TIGR02099 family)